MKKKSMKDYIDKIEQDYINDIDKKNKTIEAQAKEIQKQKESFDALAVTYSELIDENKALEKATDKEIERLEKSLKDAHKKYDILWQETQPNKRNSAAGFNQ
jgi:archaellum component FlaC